MWALLAISLGAWAIIGWRKWYLARIEADRWTERYAALMKYAIGLEDDLHDAEQLNGNLAQRNCLYESQAEMVEPESDAPCVDDYGFEIPDTGANAKVPTWCGLGLN